MSIILNHVDHIYSPGTSFAKNALSDISLKISENEFIAIIGECGSGKSTLVQILNGLLKATSGDVLFDGQDIYDRDFSLRELRFSVGLVFQYPEYQLFEETVLKDVSFGPLNMGFSEDESLVRASEALERVGIPIDAYTVSPFDLSGGQKRRVAIAGVLAMEPKYLVLDEPTAGLDPEGKREILGLLRGLHDDGKITVILTTHDMDDAAEYAGRVIAMKDGRVLLDGSRAEVFYSDAFNDTGLNLPETVKIVKQLRKNGYVIEKNPVTKKEVATAIWESYNTMNIE